jgi:hypothetical protein
MTPRGRGGKRESETTSDVTWYSGSDDQIAPKVVVAPTKAGGTMARMTRTQITLEEDEYLFLKSQAAETGTSLSSVVRRLIRDKMGEVPQQRLHVWELAGILEDCKYTNEDHDTMLYKILCEEMGLDPSEKSNG